MEVYVNNVAGLVSMGRSPARKALQGEVVKYNRHTCWVRLPNGDIIKRRQGRDYDETDAFFDAPEEVLDEADLRLGGRY